MVKFNSHHLLLVTAAAILLLFPSVAPDITSDRAALLSLRSSVGGRPLFWSLSSATPCSWAGVTCSPDNTAVVALRLPGMGLSGRLPPNTISNLTSLQTLSLRYNALSGPLPADLFASLTSLRHLFLQYNFFTGQIPDSLSFLSSLVRVNLGHNNFSGPIPPSFNNLIRLATLYLEDNHFSGPIPDLNMPLVQFNVSNNNLTGQIPRGVSTNPRSSFTGNSLCGRPLDSCGNGKPKKRLSGGPVAGIVIGSAVGFLLVLFLAICLCKCLRGKKRDSEAREKHFEILAVESGGEEIGGCFPAATAAKERERAECNVISGGKKDLVLLGNTRWNFALEDLLRASAEVLGKGAIGTTYKAVLESGLAVVVKRLRDVATAEKEFREKMAELGRLNHENLVPLRAYYYNKEEKLLVYDYLEMGSLSALLHGAGRTPLTWETRASVALDAARGISYIHAQGSSVFHGSIKSSNILLTRSYKACVSDFGLAHLAGPPVLPNRMAGYRAPEVIDPQNASQKADVYGFGVLLLELLTGKAPIHSLTNDEGVDLPRWVQSVVREEWTVEVFDLELFRYRNLEEDMVRMLKLAVDCTVQCPDDRPSMAEVSGKVEELCRRSLGDESVGILGVDADQSGVI